MTGHFSFSFAGDDIEDDGQPAPAPAVVSTPAAASTNAFPVQGKPLLPPAHHDLDHMLSRLPSKIAYGMFDIDLENGRKVQIPRRELWDVRVQLMAEEEEHEANSEAAPGLGEHDVKTGIYEGGFKSWESSVDMVKVLDSENVVRALSHGPYVSMELGCGTALPSLALFQWALTGRLSGETSRLVLTLADYNPTVLELVTLPNFLLAWALLKRGKDDVLEDAFSMEGELELTEDVVKAFRHSLASNQIELSFLSGAWSPDFVDLLYATSITPLAAKDTTTLVMGAETIYSPFALDSFATTLLSILERERLEHPNGSATAIVAAKKLYFGVGGSLDDFVNKMTDLGVRVETVHEENEGVRRGVVKCLLP